MKTSNDANFKQYYAFHQKHLALKGLQPKTIDAYSRAIRRIAQYFDWLFPNRKKGLKGSYVATTPLDRGGVQNTLHPSNHE